MAGPSQDFPWWRGFAVLWGVLAIAAAVSRTWGTLGTALLFTGGFLVQELRARQHDAPRIVAPTSVALAAVGAALGTSGIYLILRFQFKISTPWWGVPLLLMGLVLLYAAGSWVVRSLRHRRTLASEDD